MKHEFPYTSVPKEGRSTSQKCRFHAGIKKPKLTTPFTPGNKLIQENIFWRNPTYDSLLSRYLSIIYKRKFWGSLKFVKRSRQIFLVPKCPVMRDLPYEGRLDGRMDGMNINRTLH